MSYCVVYPIVRGLVVFSRQPMDLIIWLIAAEIWQNASKLQCFYCKMVNNIGNANACRRHFMSFLYSSIRERKLRFIPPDFVGISPRINKQIDVIKRVAIRLLRYDVAI